MRTFLIIALASLATLAACSQQSVEDAPMPSMTWWIDEDASILTFVSVKNGDIDEEHELTGISGSMNEDGDARIELAMNTVESFIPIRNERMAEHLFQTAQYPVAEITAQLDYGAMAPESVGESQEQRIDFVLSLREIALELSADVRITWLEEGRVRVESVEPVVVEAEDLGLIEGLNTLRELAGLDVIATVVPVSFVLEFRR